MNAPTGNNIENGDAGRLHLIAKEVIAAEEANPDPWFDEWAAWITRMIGTRPKPELGTRAHENWNLVALGALLSWGYFGAALGEDDEADSDSGGVGGDSADGADGGSGRNVPAPAGPVGPGLVKPTYAVLGPDGEPLIEGVKNV